MALSLSILVVALYISWSVLTVLNHFDFHWFWRSVSSRDIFRLIPRWTFFAPHPGVHDYFLILREGAENRWTGWVTISRYTGRKWWHLFVNPEKRIYKIYADVAASFVRDSARASDYIRIMHMQIPYFLLANLAQSSCSHADCELYQFSLVRTHGIAAEREKEVLFISEVHKKQNDR